MCSKEDLKLSRNRVGALSGLVILVNGGLIGKNVMET
jgi:hypothetical protein